MNSHPAPPPLFSYPFTVHLARPSRVHPTTGRRLVVSDQYPFRVRPLTRAEYARIRGEAADNLGIEDAILALAVLETPSLFHGEPWAWDRVWAGIAQQVVQKILTLSGFGREPDPDLIGPATAYLDGDEAKYDLLILTAFNYRLEELWDLSPELWYRLVGLAERKLAIIGIHPSAILEPGKAQGAPKGSVSLPPSTVKNHPRAGRSEQERGFVFTSD